MNTPPSDSGSQHGIIVHSSPIMARYLRRTPSRREAKKAKEGHTKRLTTTERRRSRLPGRSSEPTTPKKTGAGFDSLGAKGRTIYSESTIGKSPSPSYLKQRSGLSHPYKRFQTPAPREDDSVYSSTGSAEGLLCDADSNWELCINTAYLEAEGKFVD